MRDYGRVSPLFWTSGSGRELRGDPEAQALAVYLFTCPSSTMIGLFYLPVETMAHELGWPIEGASKALRRVCEVGIAHYDHAAELLWLPEAAHHQIGAELKGGDKRIKGIAKSLQPYANHEFFEAFVERYGEPYNLASDQLPRASKPHRSPLRGPSKPLAAEAPSKPLRSQDQDQDQDQIQDQCASDPERARTRGEADPEHTHAMDLDLESPEQAGRERTIAAAIDKRARERRAAELEALGVGPSPLAALVALLPPPEPTSTPEPAGPEATFTIVLRSEPHDARAPAPALHGETEAQARARRRMLPGWLQTAEGEAWVASSDDEEAVRLRGERAARAERKAAKAGQGQGNTPAPNGSNGAHTPDGNALSADEQRVLAELQRHPCLADFATPAMARQQLGAGAMNGSTAGEVELAIRALGAKAGGQLAAGKPWSRDFVLSQLSAYVHNAHSLRWRNGGNGAPPEPSKPRRAEAPEPELVRMAADDTKANAQAAVARLKGAAR